MAIRCEAFPHSWLALPGVIVIVWACLQIGQLDICHLKGIDGFLAESIPSILHSQEKFAQMRLICIITDVSSAVQVACMRSMLSRFHECRSCA